jgi:hypothetical protein
MGHKPLTDERIVQLSKGNKVFTYKDFNLKLGELNSTRLSPINGGLYDKQYFGSVFRDRCNCGAIRNKINVTCNVCSSTILPADEEVFRYAYIDTGVYYPIRYKEKKFVELVSSVVDIPKLKYLGLKSPMEYLMLCHYKFDSESNKILASLDYVGNEINTSLEGLMNLINLNLPDLYEKVYPHINKYLLVSPISHRPVVIRNVGGTKKVDVSQESLVYKSILFMVESIETELNNPKLVLTDKVLYRNMLRKFISIQIMNLSQINNTSKKNLVRNSIGKRISNSGRAYIVPDIDLKPDEISLPIKLGYEMFKGEFIQYLKNKYSIKHLEAEMRYIDYKTYKTLDDFREWIITKRVIINRAPSLHKGSIGCYKVVLTNNYTMGMNPLIIDSYGADNFSMSAA